MDYPHRQGHVWSQIMQRGTYLVQQCGRVFADDLRFDHLVIRRRLLLHALPGRPAYPFGEFVGPLVDEAVDCVPDEDFLGDVVADFVDHGRHQDLNLGHVVDQGQVLVHHRLDHLPNDARQGVVAHVRDDRIDGRREDVIRPCLAAFVQVPAHKTPDEIGDDAAKAFVDHLEQYSVQDLLRGQHVFGVGRESLRAASDH